jgi:hypothetical protein
MKPAGLKQTKDELKLLEREDLIEHLLKVAKYKVENKELLTYLLFEADDEEDYIKSVKDEISEQFELVNRDSYYIMKKNVRKVLRGVKKQIKYSKLKGTEVELLLHFCQELKKMRPRYTGNSVLVNTMATQCKIIAKSITQMHEDLQFDYQLELESLLD